MGEITDQPDFLNAALRISTPLEPLDLLDACKRVEAGLGRDFDAPRHAPRPLDIDVLLLGDLELAERRLQLPHPELASRRFVLEPLLELEPGLTLPDGSNLAEAHAALPEGEQWVRRVGSLVES